LQGNSAKMSSSKTESAIFLDDSKAEVKKKLMKYAFSGGKDTLEEQRKYGANPDIDFAFLEYSFLEEDQGKVDRIYQDYKSGKMLSGEMKELAAEKISEFLESLKTKKEKMKDRVGEYMFDPEKIKLYS